MAVEYPLIGSWYRHPNGSLFEVVAVDEEDGTVELQHFDGTLDEVDLETWPALLIESVGAPEDVSGPFGTVLPNRAGAIRAAR